MSKAWPRARLGEVLVQDVRYIDEPEPREYPKLSVKLYGRGVALDSPAEGAVLKMKRHQLARAGQVILSEIWGKKGAIGIVPFEGEGALCTSHFFLFDIRLERLLTGWLDALFAANYLEPQLSADAKGTTGYAAVRPRTLLNCEIPLPPLSEQRRIVEKAASLKSLINEAVRLRESAREEAALLYRRELNESITPDAVGWHKETVADVVNSMDAGWSPQCDETPAAPGAWGVFRTTAVQWCEFRPEENKALPPTLLPIPSLSVRAGDVLVTRAGPVKRVGVVAAVRDDYPNLTISDKLIRLRANPRKIEPRFLELTLASTFSQDHLLGKKTGRVRPANSS